jgi:predicted nucleotidyltransferase
MFTTTNGSGPLVAAVAAMIDSRIVPIVQRFYPDMETLYLFGSYGTGHETGESDIDLALLLPPLSAKKEGSLVMKDCWFSLYKTLSRQVDMINLRLVDTLFQNEIVQSGRLLFCADEVSRLSFEMMALSLYQKLQDERRGIVERIMQSKRVYNL